MSGLVRRFGVGAMAVAGVVLLAACGGSYKSESGSESKPVTGGPTAAPGAALTSVQDATLGKIVTDGAGFTLYRFDKDSAKPPVSNCANECAVAWPPVTAAGDPALTGIDKSLLGTINRADGSTQLTLKGWALYRFAGDTAPGQTNGQGVGGTWFVVNPTGGKALAAQSDDGPADPASDSADSADSGSGDAYSY